MGIAGADHQRGDPAWLSVAFWPGPRPYVAGLFDPIDDSALVLITAVALFNGWTLVLITGLILTYGSARFDLPKLSIRFFPLKWWGWAVGAALRGSPFIAPSGIRTPPPNTSCGACLAMPLPADSWR